MWVSFCFSVLVNCNNFNKIYSTVKTVGEPKPFTLLKSVAKARGITSDQSGKLYITEAFNRIYRISANGSDEVTLVPGLASEWMRYCKVVSSKLCILQIQHTLWWASHSNFLWSIMIVFFLKCPLALSDKYFSLVLSAAMPCICYDAFSEVFDHHYVTINSYSM